MKPLPENILRAMLKSDRAPLGKAGRTWDEMMQASNRKLEGQLHKDITNLLNQRGIWFGHSQFGKKTTFTPGAPDFIFFYRGKGCGMEAKIGNAEPSMDQLDCHCHMRRDGWLVFVVRSVEEAKAFLDGKSQVLK